MFVAAAQLGLGVVTAVDAVVAVVVVAAVVDVVVVVGWGGMTVDPVGEVEQSLAILSREKKQEH